MSNRTKESSLAALALEFAFADAASAIPTMPAPRLPGTPTLRVPHAATVPTLPVFHPHSDDEAA